MKRLSCYALLLALILGSVQAAARDQLRIGVEGAYPPFSAVDNSGNLYGFDIDIARALCEEMNVECTLVQSDWDGIIPGLLARKFDAIIASMSITEERKRRVAFTDKYYHTPARFVAPKGSNVDISAAGLAGKTVGVQRATIHDAYISDNYSSEVDIRRYGTQDEAFLDLVAGRVDLLLADSIAISEGLLDTPRGGSFEFVGPSLTDRTWFGDGAGIALRKGEDDLREEFNEALEAIRANGTYDRIASKYFDFDVYGD